MPTNPKTTELTAAKPLDFTNDLVYRTIVELAPGAQRWLDSGHISDLPHMSTQAMIDLIVEQAQINHALIAGIIASKKPDAVRVWDIRRTINYSDFPDPGDKLYLPFTNIATPLTRYPLTDDDYDFIRWGGFINVGEEVAILKGQGLLFTTPWIENEKGYLFLRGRTFKEVLQVRRYKGASFEGTDLKIANFSHMAQDITSKVIDPYPTVKEQLIIQIGTTVLTPDESYTVAFSGSVPIVTFTAPVEADQNVTFYILAVPPQ